MEDILQPIPMEESEDVKEWKKADPPNYDINENLLFPYSECPYIGQYTLIRIPKTDFIEHVDYWGVGRCKTKKGMIGFNDCYNVNYTYEIVEYSETDGTVRKVPNRIPVVSDENCNTKGYIKSNTVKIVTVMGRPISLSCASDIARMIHDEDGIVVAYGFDRDREDIKNLDKELNGKSMVCCPRFELNEKLLSVTAFDRYVAFLNSSMFNDVLYNSITMADFDYALNLSQELSNAHQESVIVDVLERLLNGYNERTMTFVYNLWDRGCRDVVTYHFPEEFHNIFDSNQVTIVSKYYDQPLKLDANVDGSKDRLAWGDGEDKTSDRLIWKFVPEPDYHKALFKIENHEYSMFLKLDTQPDSIGDRKCWGSNSSDEKRHEWLLGPTRHNGQIMFFIVNSAYEQGLKLDTEVDSYGDRIVWGHKGNYADNPDYFGWVIEAK